MRTTRLRRGNWVIAALCAFALAVALFGYGAVAASGNTPAAPSKLSAERHDGYIEIFFSHPDPSEVDGWQVRTRAGGEAWGDWYDLPDDVTPNRINAFIGDTDNDTHYRIRLRAVNEHGSGPYVKTVARSANRAAAPADLRVENEDADKIHLVWTSSGDAAITGYQYRFREVDGSWSDWLDADATVSSSNEYITVGDLPDDTEFQFKVRAMRGQVPGYVSRVSGATPEDSNSVDE